MKIGWLLLSMMCCGLMLGGAKAEESRKLLEARESLYNNIYVYEQGDFVSMTFGYNRRIYTESVFHRSDDRELPVSYTRYMTAGLIYAGSVTSVLEIGFGGGRTAWYLHRLLPQVPVTSVELDPAVVDLARKHFGIREEPNFRLVTRDGRLFLAESKERFDIIMIDAYRGPFVPFHLLTREFYELVKAHLAEGGVVVQNIEPSTMLFDSAVETINTVFPHLDFYESDGNVVTLAYGGQAKSPEDLDRQASLRQQAFQPRYDLQQMLARRRPYLAKTGMIDAKAKLLTDDFAPVEALKSIEMHNRKWVGQ